MQAMMTNLVEQLRLAERAREDIYFAKRDRELIEALHQKALLTRFDFDQQTGVDSRSRTNLQADREPSGEEARAH